jgi:hypothetical protein
VNSEIEEFNRKLKKIVTSYNHVTLLETNFERECFTRHGLHWNSVGKTLVVKLISLQINKLLGKGSQTPISLVWPDNTLWENRGRCNEERTTSSSNVNVNISNEITLSGNVSISKKTTLSSNVNVGISNENISNTEKRKYKKETRVDEINLRRISVRQRKVPITRREDFLW